MALSRPAIRLSIRTLQHHPRLSLPTPIVPHPPLPAPIPRVSRYAFHTSLRPRSSLFNLGGLSTSREAQYLAKERGIPRTEFSPRLELIRACEVDTQRVVGGGKEEVVKEEEVRGEEVRGEEEGGKEEEEVRRKDGFVTITEARYAALREAAEADEEAAETEEELSEAEEKVREVKKEVKDAKQQLREAREELKVAEEEVRKANESESEIYASVQHENGFVTMTDSQYATLLEAAETEEAEEAGEYDPSVQVSGGHVTMTEAEYTALKDEIKQYEEQLRTYDVDRKPFKSFTVRNWVMYLSDFATMAAGFLLVLSLLMFGNIFKPMKEWRKLTKPEDTEHTNPISNIFGSSKESKRPWAMSRFFWAAND